MNLTALILTLAIISGQLIKIPLSGNSGITILDIVVGFLCLVGIFNLKFRLTKPPLFIVGAIVFISTATLSLIFTPLNLQLSEYLTGFLYTARFIAYVLFGWIVLSGAFPKFRERIPQILVFSGLGLAVIGLLQFIFLPDLGFLTAEGWDPHYYRTVSTFLDPNFAGGFLVLTLLLLSSFRLEGLARPSKVFYLIFTLVYLALLTTFSRSSYLMFLVSGLTFSFLKKSRTLTLTTILLFALLLASFQIYTNLVAKPHSIDRTRSASFRISTWQQGFTLFRKSPVLGIGYNAYRYGLKEHSLADEQFLGSHGSSGNDSSLLSVAATTGIVGLIAYFYFLLTLVRFSFKKNLILISGLMGLIIHSFFANSLFYPPILAWILLISITPKK